MARIRTIKPTFWTNEKVMDCKPFTRLLFIGLWNFADDYGRMLFSAKTIKAQLFPNDNLSHLDVTAMLVELSAVGLVLIYAVNGKEFLEITGWDHQKIDKRFPSKFPDPFTDPAAVHQIPPVPADSPPIPPNPACGMEWNGRDIDSEANASGAEAPPDPAIPEREYFLRGREVLGKGSGGLIAKLLKAKGGNVALARAAIEQASQKENPTEYVAAACRGPPAGKPLTEFQRKQAETNDVRAQLRDLASSGGSGGKADRLLSLDHGERPEGVRSGAGAGVLALSRAPDRRGD